MLQLLLTWKKHYVNMKEVAVQAYGTSWDDWHYFCKKLLQ